MGGAACTMAQTLALLQAAREALNCNRWLLPSAAIEGTYWSIDRADDTATLWFTQHVDMLLACTFFPTWP